MARARDEAHLRELAGKSGRGPGASPQSHSYGEGSRDRPAAPAAAAASTAGGSGVAGKKKSRVRGRRGRGRGRARSKPKVGAPKLHDKPKPRGALCKLHLDIGGGRVATVGIRAHDNPYELARNFVKTWTLKPSAIEPVAARILSVMKARGIPAFESSDETDSDGEGRGRGGHDRGAGVGGGSGTGVGGGVGAPGSPSSFSEEKEQLYRLQKSLGVLDPKHAHSLLFELEIQVDAHRSDKVSECARACV